MTANDIIYAAIIESKLLAELIVSTLVDISRTDHLSVDKILRRIWKISPHVHNVLLANPEWLVKLDALVRLHVDFGVASAPSACE